MNRMAAGAVGAALPAIWTLRHRASPSVGAWAPSSLPCESFEPLFARWGGDGDEAVVVLHGLVSTGDIFGAYYDRLATTRRIVVPDLLGFGRSIDEKRTGFTVDDHLDALDRLAEATGLFERRWVIGAHSMGSALALRWAIRHPEHVERIVCWGAPIYPSPEAAQRHISGSVMARLFVLDTRWAERACAVSCRNRTAAGWITAALEPSLPVPVARAVSLHTWPAYRDALRHLVIETNWHMLLAELDTVGISVQLTWGTEDNVGDRDQARALSAANRGSAVTLVRGEGHHLPMSRPEICVDQLTKPVGEQTVFALLSRATR